MTKLADTMNDGSNYSKAYSSSIGYYNTNSKIFYDRTINSGMTDYYEKFIPQLKSEAKILDAGCGVGRDTRFFENLGYTVTAFDGSEEMVRLANQITTHPAQQLLFQDMNFYEEFDAAWAAASLIHVPNDELEGVINNIHKALKPSGIFFATFKHGTGQYTQEGRTFYYMTETTIRSYLAENFEVIDIWKTEDSTANVAHSPDKMWLNILVRKSL